MGIMYAPSQNQSHQIRRIVSRFFFTLPMLIIALSMILNVDALAQGSKATVKGVVKDKETNKPLVGATISVPAQRVGAVSNEKGEFKFEVPAGNVVIEVSFVGYQPLSKSAFLKAGQIYNYNLDITQRGVTTNEVVVTGLSGEVDRNKLGNTITQISANEINNVVSPSAIDALSGKVAGVQVTHNSGTPGAGTFITMRGRRTISGSSEPLYVVDGVLIDNSSLYDPSGTKQFSNRAMDINPSDIESIEILKGASAAALYGTQAGNGVVLITTKRGHLSAMEKPATISFSTNYDVGTKYGTVPLQTQFGQTKPYAPGKPGSSTSYGPALAAGTPTYKQDDVPFRTSVGTENVLSISGGIPQFDYFISGKYSKINGYVIGSDYTNTNLRVNLGASILPGLTMQSNSNFINIDNNLPQDGSNTSGILLGALRTPPEFNNAQYLEPDGSQRRFASYDNPLWSQHSNTFNSKIGRFINSTEAKFKPVDWFTLTGRIGYDRYEYTNQERLQVGSATSPSRGGLISHSRITNEATNLDLTATLSQKFMDDQLYANLVVGVQDIYNTRSADGNSSQPTLSFYDQIGAGSNKDASSSLYQTQLVGYFGQLTLTYLDKISLTAALRRDGSSTFGTSEKYHYYPKLGLSYSLSEEEFWKPMKQTMNNLRLRAAYGVAGSPSLPGAYATNFLYGTAGFFDPWDRESHASRKGFIGLRQGGGTTDEYIVAGAKDILPEKTTEIEGGLDFGFFENALQLEFTYFHQNITDMIIGVDVPSSTGYDQQLKNAAEMWNRGIEITLRATPLNNPTITWSTSLNYTKYENEVTKLQVKPEGFAATGNEFYSLNGGFTGITNVAMVGKALGVFRGYGWLRDANGNILYSTWDAVNKQVNDDDYGLNLVGAPRQATDMLIIGNPNPSFSFGWRNDFTLFNDLTVGFLIEGVFGFDIWNGTRGALYNFGTAGDTKDRNDPWYNFEGKAVMDYSDPDNPVQATKENFYRYYGNGFNINEPHVQKGNFVKVRELSIEYRFTDLKSVLGFALAVQASVRNLLTITDYTGFDPEVNTFSLAEGRGYDYFTLPQVRTFRLGISLTY